MDILISASDDLNRKNFNGMEITQLQNKFESLQRRMANEGVECSYIAEENFLSWFVPKYYNRNTSTGPPPSLLSQQHYGLRVIQNQQQWETQNSNENEINLNQSSSQLFGLDFKPVGRSSEFYNMNHPLRGVAIIFNHKHFDTRLGLKTRIGTDTDRENLRITLRQLDFEVRIYNDLQYREMENILEELSHADHTYSDCIMVIVMSHGELGILYSSDQPYKPDRLWSRFNAEKCPTLAGKPKIFLVQVMISPHQSISYNYV